MRTFDYEFVASSKITGDYNIGDDVTLLDEHIIKSVSNYRFKSSANYFIEVLQGNGTITIDEKIYTVDGHSLIIYLKGQNIETSINSEIAIQRIAIFSDDFMVNLQLDAAILNGFRDIVLSNPVVSIDNDYITNGIEYYVLSLKNIISKSSGNCMVCAKFLSLALFYGPLNEKFISSNSTAKTFHAPEFVKRFFNLLEENYANEHTQHFYSNQLCISEKYLYQIVKSSTGHSPSYWIEYQLMNKSKELLGNRSLSIKQIWEILHFSSASSFNKFITRKLGKSPSAYRKLFIK